MIFCTMSEPLAASITSVSFHRRRAQFDRGLRVRILRAVDDERPVDQVVEVGRSKPKRSHATSRDERGAGFVARIVELPAAGVPAEMLRIFRVQEGALMMIEPPGQARIARVFEIDDGVFVAIEQARIEHLRRLVGHPGIAEFRIRVNRARDEAAEEGGRGRPVKAVIVVQHAFQH